MGGGFGLVAFLVLAYFILSGDSLTKVSAGLLATGLAAALILINRRSRHWLRLRYLRWKHGRVALRGATLDELRLLHSRAFEMFCERLMRAMGYRTRLGPGTSDRGVDIEIHDVKRGDGLVQCKQYGAGGSVERPVIQNLRGEMSKRHVRYGYVLTTGTFSPGAITWAHSERIELIDGPQLQELAETYGVPALPPR